MLLFVLLTALVVTVTASEAEFYQSLSLCTVYNASDEIGHGYDSSLNEVGEFLGIGYMAMLVHDQAGLDGDGCGRLFICAEGTTIYNSFHYDNGLRFTGLTPATVVDRIPDLDLYVQISDTFPGGGIIVPGLFQLYGTVTLQRTTVTPHKAWVQVTPSEINYVSRYAIAGTAGFINKPPVCPCTAPECEYCFGACTIWYQGDITTARQQDTTTAAVTTTTTSDQVSPTNPSLPLSGDSPTTTQQWSTWKPATFKRITPASQAPPGPQPLTNPPLNEDEKPLASRASKDENIISYIVGRIARAVTRGPDGDAGKGNDKTRTTSQTTPSRIGQGSQGPVVTTKTNQASSQRSSQGTTSTTIRTNQATSQQNTISVRSDYSTRTSAATTPRTTQRGTVSSYTGPHVSATDAFTHHQGEDIGKYEKKKVVPGKVIKFDPCEQQDVIQDRACKVKINNIRIKKEERN